MARRTLDLGLVMPSNVGRDVTETITGSDRGELVRDANGELFFISVPGHEDKLTVEYSGTGDWATPSLEGLRRGDEVTVKLLGWNVAGVQRTLTGLVDSVSITFNEMKQTVSWSLRVREK